MEALADWSYEVISWLRLSTSIQQISRREILQGDQFLNMLDSGIVLPSERLRLALRSRFFLCAEEACSKCSYLYIQSSHKIRRPLLYDRAHWLIFVEFSWIKSCGGSLLRYVIILSKQVAGQSGHKCKENPISGIGVMLARQTCWE